MTPHVPPSYRVARLLIATVLLLTIGLGAYAVVTSQLPERIRAGAGQLADWARGAWES